MKDSCQQLLYATPNVSSAVHGYPCFYKTRKLTTTRRKVYWMHFQLNS